MRTLRSSFVKLGLDRVYAWTVLGPLGILPLLAWSSSPSKSPTFDEPYQVVIGYAIWMDGAQCWEFRHPSFGRLWVASPLLFLGLEYPAGVTHQGDLAHQFVFHNQLSSRATFCWTRPTMLIPALWLALGVYLWSRELFGTRAGMLSLSLAVLDPNIVAHAGLAKNDMLVTAAVFWAAYLFWWLGATVHIPFVRYLYGISKLFNSYSGLMSLNN